VVECFDGGGGGLTPLAGAADQDAVWVGLEDFGLGFVEGNWRRLAAKSMMEAGISRLLATDEH
jgi:hypothetical protein